MRNSIVRNSLRLMLKQLMQLEWDVAIILDACRYDYFAKVYQDFLYGTLRKAVTPGTKTADWARRVFREKYDDVIYISANPIINSRVAVWGFNAKKHFYKVIDVWDLGWNRAFGTVPPWNVNEVAIRCFERYCGNKRFIIHYLQPHAPYLPMYLVGLKIDDPYKLVGLGRVGYSKNRHGLVTTFSKETCKYAHELWSLLIKILGPKLPKWLPRQCIVWKARKILGIPSHSPEEFFYRSFSIREIQTMYELNLRFVLKYVSKLIRHLINLNPKLKIIITSDHGELLGERGELGHDVGGNLSMRHLSKLIIVPWFIVLKPKEHTSWYGNEDINIGFVRYFEQAEKELKLRDLLALKLKLKIKDVC